MGVSDMTRPRKDVVDFFPHYIARGKTIPILEKKYGNDGYAFWWKTLEILGMSEGHYFDCNNPTNWEYLTAYTLVSEDIANEILNLLAKLDAIDNIFWKKRIIWTGNFIENLVPLYARRKQKPPSKEDIVNILTLSEELLHTETLVTGIIDNINPHSRVEYSRVEYSKGEEEIPLSTAEPIDGSNGFKINELATLWNEKKPPELPKVNVPFNRKPKQLKPLQDSIKRNPSKEFWLRILEKIHYSSFLRGKSKSGWRANFDFIVDKANEIDDGKYIDHGSATQSERNISTASNWLKKREDHRNESTG
jgi:hypothetical protein